MCKQEQNLSFVASGFPLPIKKKKNNNNKKTTIDIVGVVSFVQIYNVNPL
jgi:hypothetical protein